MNVHLPTSPSMEHVMIAYLLKFSAVSWKEEWISLLLSWNAEKVLVMMGSNWVGVVGSMATIICPWASITECQLVGFCCFVEQPHGLCVSNSLRHRGRGILGPGKES